MNSRGDGRRKVTAEAFPAFFFFLSKQWSMSGNTKKPPFFSPRANETDNHYVEPVCICTENEKYSKINRSKIELFNVISKLRSAGNWQQLLF